MNETQTSLEEWIPVKIKAAAEGPLVRWRYLDKKRFTEPFFEETILRCCNHSNNLSRFESTTGMDGLELMLKPGLVLPTAFIFHISRCGSTLLSQLLSIPEENIVMSEMPVLDQVLRWNYQPGVDQIDTEKSFMDLINIVGRKRMGREKNLFIKADSWHIMFYNQIRSMFPGVPFILLFRKPDEVIRSQQKQKGMHAVPGLIENEVFNFGINETFLNADLYLSRVLEKYIEEMIRVANSDPDCLLLNYTEGFEQMMERISNLTHTPFSEDQLEDMKKRSIFHAKKPGEYFSEEPLTSNIPAYQFRVMELYNQLEEIRVSKMND